MRVAIPKESHPGENRVPITPEVAKKLCRMGADLVIETGMGLGSGFTDAEYTEVGASISTDRGELFASADLLLRLRKPTLEEVALMKSGCIHISYLDPFNEHELVNALKAQVSGSVCHCILQSLALQVLDHLPW